MTTDDDRAAIIFAAARARLDAKRQGLGTASRDSIRAQFRADQGRDPSDDTVVRGLVLANGSWGRLAASLVWAYRAEGKEINRQFGSSLEATEWMRIPYAAVDLSGSSARSTFTFQFSDVDSESLRALCQSMRLENDEGPDFDAWFYISRLADSDTPLMVGQRILCYFRSPILEAAVEQTVIGPDVLAAQLYIDVTTEKGVVTRIEGHLDRGLYGSIIDREPA